MNNHDKFPPCPLDPITNINQIFLPINNECRKQDIDRLKELVRQRLTILEELKTLLGRKDSESDVICSITTFFQLLISPADQLHRNGLISLTQQLITLTTSQSFSLEEIKQNINAQQTKDKIAARETTRLEDWLFAVKQLVKKLQENISEICEIIEHLNMLDSTDNYFQKTLSHIAGH